MKYTIKWTSRFKKEYKLLMKRGEDIQALDHVIRLLADGAKLPPEYHAHILTGRYAGLHECHVHPDLLLIYDLDGHPGADAVPHRFAQRFILTIRRQ